MSQLSATVALVMLAGGSNVLRDLIALAVGIRLGPIYDPSNFAQ